MKKIVMTVYGSRHMSYKERLEYAGKAFVERYAKQKSIGYIEKFNSAYGFKKLLYNSETHASEIQCPDNYYSPYLLLLYSRKFLNRKNEISTFIIENKMMIHPLPKYTYNTLSMLISFQHFLYKVFPSDIKIEFFEVEKMDFPSHVKILSHFWNCISQDDCVDTAISLGHRITKKEKRYVLNVMKQALSFEPDIRCWLCESCFNYNPNYPYHIELVDKIRESAWIDDSRIECGYWEMSNIRKREAQLKKLERQVNLYQHSKNYSAEKDDWG